VGLVDRSGDLLHIDVKKLGRIHAGAGHRVTGKRRRHTRDKADAAGVLRRQTGWEYVPLCVDDATRLAYVEVLRDETARTIAGDPTSRIPANRHLIADKSGYIAQT
jgi:hypothetical protein